MFIQFKSDCVFIGYLVVLVDFVSWQWNLSARRAVPCCARERGRLRAASQQSRRWRSILNAHAIFMLSYKRYEGRETIQPCKNRNGCGQGVVSAAVVGGAAAAAGRCGVALACPKPGSPAGRGGRRDWVTAVHAVALGCSAPLTWLWFGGASKSRAAPCGGPRAGGQVQPHCGQAALALWLCWGRCGGHWVFVGSRIPASHARCAASGCSFLSCESTCNYVQENTNEGLAVKSTHSCSVSARETGFTCGFS